MIEGPTILVAKGPVGTALDVAQIGALLYITVLLAFGLLGHYFAWRRGIYANPLRLAFLGPGRGMSASLHLLDAMSRVMLIVYFYAYTTIALIDYDYVGRASLAGKAALLALLAAALAHNLPLLHRDVRCLASLLGRCEDQRYEAYEEEGCAQARPLSGDRDKNGSGHQGYAQGSLP